MTDKLAEEIIKLRNQKVTMQEKVEAWIKKAPPGLKISNVHVRLVSDTVKTFGRITPVVISEGYAGCLVFACDTWEEE